MREQLRNRNNKRGGNAKKYGRRKQFRTKNNVVTEFLSQPHGGANSLPYPLPTPFFSLSFFNSLFGVFGFCRSRVRGFESSRVPVLIVFKFKDIRVLGMESSRVTGFRDVGFRVLGVWGPELHSRRCAHCRGGCEGESDCILVCREEGACLHIRVALRDKKMQQRE